MKWGAGNRDELKTYTGAVARLDRAERNFLETFPFFAAAILIAHAVDRENALSTLGAGLYFAARVAYLPLYAFGVKLWRSLAWFVSIAGLVLVLIALL